jgi:hypothetical protein
MGDKIHGFPEAAHKAKVNKHVQNIPGNASKGLPAMEKPAAHNGYDSR